MFLQIIHLLYKKQLMDSTGAISKPPYIHLCAISETWILEQENCYISAMLLSPAS
jgi:hypothetical protein